MTPLASEKIIRAILKTLVHVGTLATSADTALLEAIPVNATDAQIDAVVAALTHSVAPITGVSTSDLTSDGDITCWVDADASPAGGTNFFRVAGWGTTAADIYKTTEWATVSRPLTSSFIYSETTAVIGPRKALIANTDLTGYPANLNIGTYHEGAGPGLKAQYYGTIAGSATALTGNGYSAVGLKIWTKKQMELSSYKYLGVVDSASNAVRGGFYNLDTDGAYLFVGSYPGASSLVDSVTLGKIAGGAAHDFQLRMTRTGAYETLYFNSAENTLVSACMAVNGDYYSADRRPDTYPDVGTQPAFSAFGTDSGTNTVGLFSSLEANYTGASVLRVVAKDSVHSGLYNLIIAETWDGFGAYVHKFRVTGNGNAYCVGAFTGGGADLAEWIPTRGLMEPGTVVVLRDGQGVASDRYRAAGVIGVVSTQPGLCMNGDCANHVDYTLVARSGMVPVKFSTEFGGVDGNGEMLCAGPNGHCVRAPQFPEPGTIVGKSMGTLHRAADGSITTGVIMAVVG